MSRRLLLIRHAKSSWKFPELDDHERPLNKRGKRDIHTMGQQLKSRSEALQAIYSSSAVRALTLARCLAEHTGVACQASPGLYTFDVDHLLTEVSALPAEYDCVALVGHNPAITAAVNFLTGSSLANVPTSGIAAMQSEVDAWDNLAPASFKLEYFDYPKKFTKPAN